MEALTFPLLSALWLGILTSISPCPLASNIAAVSFVLKKIEHTSFVFRSGILYTAGRVIGYTALGFLITSSLLSIPQTANFLQNYMNKVLGPILIVTGSFLLGIFRFTFLGLSSLTVLRSSRFSIFSRLPIISSGISQRPNFLLLA